MKHIPRVIALETTRQCPLNCRHCRAGASDSSYEGELSTEEIFSLLKNIASFASPVVILTGGEPMTREDIYEIASYGTSLGLRMVMAPCGPLVTRESIDRMKESGIKRISLSLDGWDQESHDAFRSTLGSYDSVVQAARFAKEGGLEFQINTTVTRLNFRRLESILSKAVELGAVGFHPFLLVPTGRGKGLKNLELNPREYEETLKWIYLRSRESSIEMKPTCAPHYYRILRQSAEKEGIPVTPENFGINARTRGCLGGQGFAFISHRGKVQICGFLEEEAGDLRTGDMNFREVWQTSRLFHEVRSLKEYRGKCGSCSYKAVCGGCRARAFVHSGDYLGEEPYCLYIPGGVLC